MTYYVYQIAQTGTTSLDEGYIGVSVDPKRRWKAHQSRLRQGFELTVYQRIREIGLDNVTFTVIEEYETEKAAYDREAELRPLPDMGWNQSCGGATANYGNVVEFEGEVYPSINSVAKMLGVDRATAQKIVDGKPVFQSGREYSVAKKAVVIKSANTTEEHSFPSLQEAWEFIGKQGHVSGNIAKQSKKGRPAYGYYWTY